ncbi:MAG: hypothetical protein Q4G19_04465 [Clostridia bacterium]|nr:hypothetical protein [Clostridia bacterium]
MTQMAYLQDLGSHTAFSRDDLTRAMQQNGCYKSEATFKATLTKLLRAGTIVRVGRNQYSVSDGRLNSYSHEYSAEAEKLADIVQQDFPFVRFTVFELIQLNEFVNHLIGNNTIILSVEAEMMEFVFASLKDRYPGAVLLDPDLRTYTQYWSENMIIIRRLITEAPAGAAEPWHTGIEKLLVDLWSDPILSDIISESEYPSIYEQAFEKYVVDESCMFRYASRRKSAARIREFIHTKTAVKLRTEE